MDHAAIVPCLVLGGGMGACLEKEDKNLRCDAGEVLWKVRDLLVSPAIGRRVEVLRVCGVLGSACSVRVRDLEVAYWG